MVLFAGVFGSGSVGQRRRPRLCTHLVDQDTRPKGASLVANTFIPDPGVMRTAFPRDAHTRARQSDRRTGIVFACIGDRTSYRT
jgi:hypothetical protein